MTKYGFIGMGIMGSAMARNLVKAGYDLTVWNRDPKKCVELQGLGAKAGMTPRDVVEESDVTFAMLADPEAAAAVFFQQNGVLDGLEQGKGYVDMSTVDDYTSKAIERDVKGSGASFLEAPVSGSKGPAEQGTLIILAGGDKKLYDEVAGPFEVMGKMSLYLGHVGNGARMKLCVNMVMGVMMAGFCEGLSLAKEAGLSQREFLTVLAEGAMANPMFALKGPLMLVDDYAPNFPLKHMQKDMRLAVGLGDDVGQPLPVSAVANELFKGSSVDGFGDDDFSALFKSVKRS